MSINYRFYTLRKYLEEDVTRNSPSIDLWNDIVELFNDWPVSAGRADALEYAERHLIAWPDELRVSYEFSTSRVTWPLVRTLDLSAQQDISDADVATIAASSDSQKLTTLILKWTNITNAAVTSLVNSTFLPNLTSLNIEKTSVTSSSINDIANLANFKLNELFCGSIPLDSSAVTAIANSTTLDRLFNLDLRMCSIDDAKLAILAGSANLTNIKFLNLEGNQIGDAGATSLANSAYLKNIERINLEGNQIGDAGAIALAGSTNFEKTRYFRIVRNNLGITGSDALINSTSLRNVFRLEYYRKKKSYEAESFIKEDNATGDEILDDIFDILDLKADKINVLELDNTFPFTPTSPYHPATKDYVDSLVAGGSPVLSVNTKTGHVVLDTDDISEGVTNLWYTDGRVDSRIGLQKGVPNGLATLAGDGKIPTSQLPALAVTDVFVVADITARDALTVQSGDVAKVLDAGATYSNEARDFIFDGSSWIILEGDPDLTAGEIKTLYESNLDTNAFTDALLSKLNGIESGATADQNASEVPYNNVASGLTATDVQAALDEIDATIDGLSFDHGNLSGLADDDHVQYHNDARGDARYYTKTLLDAGQLDNRYYTEGEINTFLGNKADKTTTMTAGDGLSGGGSLSANRTFSVQAEDGSILVSASGIKVGILSASQHGNLAGGALHAVATPSIAGFMSGSDKTKLDGIEAGATADQNASEVPYSNATSGLTAINVQTALDEIDATIDSISDHGNLSGLADDDHVQYHNDARGDARYYTKTLLDAGQLDTRYYTETETDNLLNTKADKVINLTAGDGLSGGGDLSANRTFSVQAEDGSILVSASGIKVGAISAGQHGNLAGGSLHALATITTAGFMSSADKVKIDGVEAGATADQNASEVPYNNATSGLTAVDVQSALDEIDATIDSIADHGNLLGLADDDHIQYHTDARGDARYYTKTLLDAGQLDNRYYTETETNSLLNAKADKVTTMTAGNGLSGGGDLSANRTFSVQAEDGSILVSPLGIKVGVLSSGQHGDQAGGSLHALATPSVAGFMSPSDKSKLNIIEAGATADQNAAEVPYSNTSSGLAATDVQAAIDELDTIVDTLVTDHGNLSGLADDDHTQYHTDARGDLRYYTKTLLDGGQLDNRYYTETEVDGFVNAKADKVTTMTAGNGLSGGGDLSANRTFSVLAQDGSIVVSALGIKVGVLSASQHGNLSGGSLHAVATISTAGFMSSSDKTKLDGIESGATADQNASEVPYNNATSGLTAIDVQSALDEIDATIDSISDHGNLSGLADDDHVQYHNDTRGDARYYTKTLLDTGQLDNRYYTETEIDGLLNAKADKVTTMTAGNGLTGGGDLSANRTFSVQAEDGSILVSASGIKVGALSASQHGNQAGGSLHDLATVTVAGFMSSVDKIKLDGIESGATADQNASEVPYNNATSGLTATDVQSALDELDASIDVISDHGGLTGLADDDHTQYHTDARGDARYYTKTLLDGGQLDSRYYTETEVDGFVNAKADKAIVLTAGDGLSGGGDLSANRTFSVQVQDASIVVGPTGIKVGVLSASQHGNLSGGALHALATISVAGFMSSSDKTKLDGIESGATADQNASEVPYNNATSGLTAINVQAALDEIDATIDSISDHGNLSGLADDDHLQYHNDTRGDLRYYTKALLDGGQLDNRYYTETETDGLLNAKADKTNVLELDNTTIYAPTANYHPATKKYVDDQISASSPVLSVNTKTGHVVLDTDDISEGVTNLWYTDGRVDARISLQKGAPNGLATLAGDGKIPASQLPALAITDVYVVADITARDALVVQSGDVAKVLDAGPSENNEKRDYIFDGSSWIILEGDPDLTASEIKTLYESNLDTNAFTDALLSKLNGIESGATADQNASEVPYNNATSGLTAINVQAAIDEIDATIDSISDHGNLSGLADDDHLQYHNDARGDIRYYTKTLLDAGQLDSRYYTETETNSLLNAKADKVTTMTAGNGLTGGGDLSANRTFSVQAQDASIVVTAFGIRVGALSSSQHGDLPGGTLHAIATVTTAGFMSSADKLKLNGIESGATADQNASEVPFNNATSGLTATDVQSALDEIDATIDSISDHGNLSGLADDDHVQYHNDARGDIRYYTKTLLDAGQLDNRYYTETEVDGLVNAKADKVTIMTAGDGISGGGDLSANRTFSVQAEDGSILVSPLGIKVGVLSGSQHGNLSGGSLHALATFSVAGFMSSSDKTKLDGIESGATADQNAAEVPYNNATSGLTATDVQSALDEIDATIDSISDHGNLSGLADDDHVQYHNDARGDIRYYTKTLLDAGQLDNRYYTETETNSLLNAKADKVTTMTAGNGLSGGGDLSANRTFSVQAEDGSILVSASGIKVGALSASQHGNQAGGSLHDLATVTVAGFMSSVDKIKLDGIESGATADQNASEVPFNNTASGLTATDVQSALDEIDATIDSISDHGNLSGLADDDHIQYHTDARGDARYYTKTLLDGGQLDSRYYTETEVDGLVNAKADKAIVLTAGDGLSGGGDLSANRTFSVQAEDGSILVSASGIKIGAISASQHGNLIGGALHALATISVAGFMSSSDKTKLDGIESGATADQNASEVPYNNTASGLTATDVQSALDEIDATIDSISDHGNLSGLADDDHIQYHNDARGDARYYTKALLDAGQLDSRYYTETETNSLLNAKADKVTIMTAGNGLTGGGDLSANRTFSVQAEDGSILVSPLGIKVGVLSGSQHGNLGGGSLHAIATISTAGFMSSSDKTKLDGIESGATADQNASEVPYNNATSGLTATDVQAAIDEVLVAVGSGDHGNLAGLGDDDHPQYHNDARGDARYYTQAQLNAGQLDNRYYTETETDGLLNAKADKANVLELDNTTAYAPTADYHPATKKYVDDNGFNSDRVFNVYQSTSTQTNLLTFIPVPFNVARNSTPDFSLNPTTGDVTINKGGTFMVTYNVSTDKVVSNARAITEAAMFKNGIEVVATRSYAYNRNTALGEGTASQTALITMVATDVLSVQFRILAGSGDIATIANASNLMIMRVFKMVILEVFGEDITVTELFTNANTFATFSANSSQNLLEIWDLENIRIAQSLQTHIDNNKARILLGGVVQTDVSLIGLVSGSNIVQGNSNVSVDNDGDVNVNVGGNNIVEYTPNAAVFNKDIKVGARLLDENGNPGTNGQVVIVDENGGISFSTINSVCPFMPKISDISPCVVQKNKTENILIRGMYLHDTVSVSFPDLPSIVVNNVTCDALTGWLTVNITTGGVSGITDIVINNGIGNAVVTSCFKVIQSSWVDCRSGGDAVGRVVTCYNYNDPNPSESNAVVARDEKGMYHDSNLYSWGHFIQFEDFVGSPNAGQVFSFVCKKTGGASMFGSRSNISSLTANAQYWEGENLFYWNGNLWGHYGGVGINNWSQYAYTTISSSRWYRYEMDNWGRNGEKIRIYELPGGEPEDWDDTSTPITEYTSTCPANGQTLYPGGTWLDKKKFWLTTFKIG